MAEQHAKSAGEILVGTNDGTRGVTEKDSTTTTKSSKDSHGCASSYDPARSLSEYFSPRIEALMESRTEHGFNLEVEIEASKDHWSDLQAISNGEGGSSAEKNLTAFRSLQQQYGGPQGFFQDWSDDWYLVGEKIAEGAQAEIFKMRHSLEHSLPELAEFNNMHVLKVFKLEGLALQDLQKQWPLGMLLKAKASGNGRYVGEGGSAILGGVMLNGGRFAFQMLRMWGDLRKLIDLRMEHNGNQAPPFTYVRTLCSMYDIALGMRKLHKDNIVHRDLKASNVLISSYIVENGVVYKSNHIGFNPLGNEEFCCSVADFECSVGVVGTRYWRAPEILLGMKNHDTPPSLFTKEADVYSYAMTCYEILTGQIPFEDVPLNDYDVVLNGARPVLPSDIEPWVHSLLHRCWHHDPSQRPSFKHIVDLFKYKTDTGLSKLFKTGPKLLVRKLLRT